MKIYLRFLVITSLWVALSSSASTRELVLVGSSDALQPFSRFEVRKIFLGYPMDQNGVAVSAIRNTTDPEAYQVFLQKLIRVSEKNYERRLMSNTFRTGAPSVLAESSLDELVEALHKNREKVSFMWLDEVDARAGLTVIQSLWKEAKNVE